MTPARVRPCRALGTLLVPLLVLTATTVEAQWTEDFDSYAVGSYPAGQNGWDSWGAACTASGGEVSGARAHSAPNSLVVPGADNDVDIYRLSSGYTVGHWVVRAWVYVPTGFTADSWFTLYSSYSRTDCASTAAPTLWLGFRGGTGEVENDQTSPATTPPLLRDQWVELRFDFDLDADWAEVYYGDTRMYAGTWTQGAPGYHLLNLAAVNVYAYSEEATQPMLYDDISLAAWAPPAVPALPASGLATLALLVAVAAVVALRRNA